MERENKKNIEINEKFDTFATVLYETEK